jgi:hypothetical protein
VQEVRQQGIVLLGQNDVPRAPLTNDTGDVGIAHGVVQAPGSLSPELCFADERVYVSPPYVVTVPCPGSLTPSQALAGLKA